MQIRFKMNVKRINRNAKGPLTFEPTRRPRPDGPPPTWSSRRRGADTFPIHEGSPFPIRDQTPMSGLSEWLHSIRLKAAWWLDPRYRERSARLGKALLVLEREERAVVRRLNLLVAEMESLERGSLSARDMRSTVAGRREPIVDLNGAIQGDAESFKENSHAGPSATRRLKDVSRGLVSLIESLDSLSIETERVANDRESRIDALRNDSEALNARLERMRLTMAELKRIIDLNSR